MDTEKQQLRNFSAAVADCVVEEISEIIEDATADIATKISGVVKAGILDKIQCEVIEKLRGTSVFGPIVAVCESPEKLCALPDEYPIIKHENRIITNYGRIWNTYSGVEIMPPGVPLTAEVIDYLRSITTTKIENGFGKTLFDDVCRAIILEYNNKYAFSSHQIYCEKIAQIREEINVAVAEERERLMLWSSELEVKQHHIDERAKICLVQEELLAIEKADFEAVINAENKRKSAEESEKIACQQVESVRKNIIKEYNRLEKLRKTTENDRKKLDQDIVEFNDLLMSRVINSTSNASTL